MPAGSEDIFDASTHSDMRDQIDISLNGAWRRLYHNSMQDLAHSGVCPTQAWKHTAIGWDPVFNTKKAHVLFCVRNPYSWIISLQQHPYHIIGPRPKTLQEFVVRPWMTQHRDNVDVVLSNPMQLWNSKLASYHTFADQDNWVKPQTIQFEHFVAKPRREVIRVLSAFRIPHSKVRLIKTSTKIKGKPLHEISAYYAREGWREHLTKDLVETLNTQIDWDIARSYGYARLDPVDFPDEPLHREAGSTSAT